MLGRNGVAVNKQYWQRSFSLIPFFKIHATLPKPQPGGYAAGRNEFRDTQ